MRARAPRSPDARNGPVTPTVVRMTRATRTPAARPTARTAARTAVRRRRGPVSGALAGAVAGAAGTTVLNAVTYGDMAWRGRAPSSLPADVVAAAAERWGTPVPGSRAERAHRTEAYGALGGIVAGVGAGKVVGFLRGCGLRMPPVLGGIVTGAVAMAATDWPAHALGVTDVRTWTREDWVADAVPHLAFGLATHATLRALDPPAPRPARRAEGGTAVVDRPEPSGASVVARSALLGVAAGARSSLGVAGPAVLSAATAAVPSGAVATALGTLAVGGELVADKLPATPSRLSASGLPVRLVTGALGGGVLGRREGAGVVAPALAGLLGAVVGSNVGAAWRAWAGQRVPDWQAALVEDAVALGLTVVAVVPGRRR